MKLVAFNAGLLQIFVLNVIKTGISMTLILIINANALMGLIMMETLRVWIANLGAKAVLIRMTAQLAMMISNSRMETVSVKPENIN